MKAEDKAGETEEGDFDCLWDEEVLIHTSDSVSELVVQTHFILSFTLMRAHLWISPTLSPWGSTQKSWSRAL